MIAGDGELHEREAEAFLKKSGLTLVARNWRCRLGEIDLIMKDGATLVFVEVRKRGSERFGGAIASIGTQKQAKLQRAIGLYLTTLPNTPACRVDAVLFDGKSAPVWKKISWVRDRSKPVMEPPAFAARLKRGTTIIKSFRRAL